MDLVRKLREIADKLEQNPGAYVDYEYAVMPISSEPRLVKLAVWVDLSLLSVGMVSDAEIAEWEKDD